MIAPADARLRHYLEQMMFIFLGARVPVAEAAEHLAEVESHCIEVGDGEPADPFEHFGDPHDFARQLNPTDRLGRIVISALFPALAFIAGLVFFAAIISVFGGSVSVIELQVGMVISLVWIPVALAVPKQSVTPRVEAWAHGLAVMSLVLLAVLGLGIDSLFPSGTINLRPLLWVPLALVVIPGFLIGTWFYHRPRQLGTPVPVGVTADVVEGLGKPGVFKDWIRYDPDGDPLPATVKEELDGAAAVYRTVAYDLRRWAADTPDAPDESFTSLHYVMAQALALLAFVVFAGLALMLSPSDTMRSAGEWLLFLAPITGLYLLISNFSQRRRK